MNFIRRADRPVDLFTPTSDRDRKGGGTTLASTLGVRLLEARFHPGSKAASRPVAVGRVSWKGGVARVEPVPLRAEAVKPFEPVALLRKLELMVASTVGDPFQALRALRSGFWSFVEIDDGGHRGDGT